MILFHFLSAEHALDDLDRKRLKVAEIGNLNDPFELWSGDHRDPAHRAAFRLWKREMAAAFGMLCFSAGWSNPLLWSHYADHHKGICLGFEIPDGDASPVRYVKTRTPTRPPFTEQTMRRLLFTKYSGWSYEAEWRLWCRLGAPDPDIPNMHFRGFDDGLLLREVIAGPLCELPETSIRGKLEHYSNAIKVRKARLAFKSFRVVRNLKGFKIG
jgi:hypothetical protein